MDRHPRTRFGFIVAAAAMVHGAICSVGHAEITLDDTFGPPRTLPGGDYIEIPAAVGEQMGANLFHSFGVFNIDIGQMATFTGPDAIQNVLARVTGGSESVINGTLRSDIVSADLYLINPAGVMFGENAQVDVRGSFHTSTADYVRLGEAGRFAATMPETSRLSVAPPSAFGFLDADPAPISIHGGNLSNALPGRTFTIAAGDIRMEGGSLIAPGGRANLVSVASSGEIDITDGRLNTDTFVQLGDIQLSRDAVVDASGARGGRIVIRGGQLTLDNAALSAQTSGSGGTAFVDIKVTGDVTIAGRRAQISTTTQGVGPAGDITVVAGGTLLIRDDGFIETEAPDTGNGDAGTVTVRAGNMTLIDGGHISSQTNGAGKAGDLNIDVTGTFLISASGEGNIRSHLVARALLSESDAGNITISAGTLRLRERASIDVSASRGDGGNIMVMAGSVQLTEASTISATVTGDRNSTGGNVSFNTGSLVILDSQGVIANAGQGQGGVITVTSPVFLHDGANVEAVLDASSRTAGNDGTVTVNSPDTDVAGSITRLPVSFLNAAALLSEPCATRTGIGRSRFVVTGRGGIPPGPDNWLGAYAGGTPPNEIDDVRSSMGRRAGEATQTPEKPPAAFIGCANARHL